MSARKSQKRPKAPASDPRFTRPEPGTPSEHERLCFGEGVELLEPESEAELVDLLAGSTLDGKVVIPGGLGHHAYLGPPPEGEVVILSTSRLNEILRYEPDDFTVGVQAGLPLEEFRQKLAENDQELALEIAPRRGGTVGGLVASGWNGPRRHRALPRNLIIGMTGLRGDGQRFRSGGMVVKNVAGYDLAKLMVGSLGTLGVILEVNFKLRQRPEQRFLGLGSFSASEEAFAFATEFTYNSVEPSTLEILDPVATGKLMDAVGSPALEAARDHWSVVWAFEGNDGTVGTARSEVDALLKSQSRASSGYLEIEESVHESVLDTLTRFQEPDDPFREDLLVARLSLVPRNTSRLASDVGRLLEESDLEAEGQVYSPRSGIALLAARGDEKAQLELLTRLRDLAREAEAQGRLLFAPRPVRVQQTGSLRADPNRALTEKIQRVFDPRGRFHAGRL